MRVACLEVVSNYLPIAGYYQKGDKMITHTKEFGIYHWDTFDNETLLVGEADTITEAVELIKEKYNISNTIRADFSRTPGADRVEVVDLSGNILRHFDIR